MHDDGTPTYTVRQDEDGYYCHISRAGYPGDETDRYDSPAEAVAAVEAKHPDAIPLGRRSADPGRESDLPERLRP